uniref:Apple domain-containing protein n=1 Tax=Magallana gigas TaxID=29159 RepID=A0A8W8JET2_MAGGI
MTKITAIFVLLSIHGSEAGIYSLFTPASRLSGFIMEKISPIGMDMCVRECSKRVSCASVNFHRGRLECELSYSDVTANPSNKTSDSEFIYIGRNQIPQEYFDACSASCSTRRRCVTASTGHKCVQSDCPTDHPDSNSTGVKVTSTKIGTVLTYTGDGTWTSSATSCIVSLPELPDCFNTTTSCWVQHNFTYDNTWDGCTGGTRYVRRTQYPSAPYVGVVLCSPTRYKILLGPALTDTFLNVGDGSGSGADHCELVGGLEADAVMANDYTTAPALTGYYRSSWGQAFTIGLIGYSETSYFYNSWQECGVTIPPPSEPACFNTTTSCWYEYSFDHDTAWNGCTGGKRYVMKTKYTSAPIVGVELCNSTRYQLFLGANLTDTFLNIGDGSGEGADHCELVGGLEVNAVLPGTYSSAPALTGYARSSVGQEFNIQAIAGGSGWYSNPWYECGVKIPWPHEPACMSATPPCWYAHNVSVDNSFNGCTGQILVKRTNYTSAPYLAVQLCSSTRYKLFLGSSLGATFMNIGDGSGSGADHCELVGGSEANALDAGNYVSSPSVDGYYRNTAGQEFSYGPIGYIQSSYYFHSFLECGVSIPGTNTVVYG